MTKKKLNKLILLTLLPGSLFAKGGSGTALSPEMFHTDAMISLLNPPTLGDPEVQPHVQSEIIAIQKPLAEALEPMVMSYSRSAR